MKKKTQRSYAKSSNVVVPADNRTTFDVYVVVRHTRAGDRRMGVHDAKQVAMTSAEHIADEAAMHYGYGSASVFPARLEYTGPAIKPEDI